VTRGRVNVTIATFVDFDHFWGAKIKVIDVESNANIFQHKLLF
jgi:hypothetical protein